MEPLKRELELWSKRGEAARLAQLTFLYSKLAAGIERSGFQG